MLSPDSPGDTLGADRMIAPRTSVPLNGAAAAPGSLQPACSWASSIAGSSPPGCLISNAASVACVLGDAVLGPCARLRATLPMPPG